MNTSRFIVGLILIAVAVAMFLPGGENYSTASAIGLASWVLPLSPSRVKRKQCKATHVSSF